MSILDELLKKAESGDSYSYFQLERIFASIGDEKSNSLASYYFMLGIDLDDNPLCYFAMGEAYLFGELIAVDEKMSDACYVSSLQGLLYLYEINQEPEIAFFIGTVFFRCKSLLNYTEAFYWFNIHHQATRDPKSLEMTGYCNELLMLISEQEESGYAAEIKNFIESDTIVIKKPQAVSLPQACPIDTPYTPFCNLSRDAQSSGNGFFGSLFKTGSGFHYQTE